LAQYRGMQQIKGEHMVGPDGTIRLGIYGSVFVAGMTLDEARSAIESHLSAYLQKPEVSVDVFAYNSKVYYVITDGGGFGEQVIPLPATGNETVLDAMSKVGG
ncbi:MAG TPA: polysaccharide biosynthesis/export family protein, partial [Gemmatales bacterium]|nr:polysaccharide biosynthesis/export family protein [Gemmatales bacterium]